MPKLKLCTYILVIFTYFILLILVNHYKGSGYLTKNQTFFFTTAIGGSETVFENRKILKQLIR